MSFPGTINTMSLFTTGLAVGRMKLDKTECNLCTDYRSAVALQSGDETLRGSVSPRLLAKFLGFHLCGI